MPKPFHQIGTFCLLVASSVTTLIAQTDKPLSVDEIVGKAAAQRENYLRQFEGLLSAETKTFQIFDDAGQVKKTRVVRSTFIIYRLTKGQDMASEFRNVLEVDGKPTDGANRRAEDFFVKILKANSAAKEAQRVYDESVRYDLDILVNGFTMFQSVALDENLRPYCEFKIEGKQTFNGANVYVVSFRQIRFCPFIAANTRVERTGISPLVSYYLNLKPNVDYRERLSGKLLIDAKTFQVWSEERLMTLQPDGFSAPVPLSMDAFTFQKSGFGILTPRTILHTQYQFREKEKTSVKQGTVLFEYEKFTKPDVEVKGINAKATS